MRFTMTRARRLHALALRSPARWRTKFGAWISDYTSSAIVRDLGAHSIPITRMSVYHWLACRTVPRPTVARALVELSQGRLTLEDIYSHADECRKQIDAT